MLGIGEDRRGERRHATVTAHPAHGVPSGQLPAMIQILQVMASRGDLLNYLTIFRLLLRLTWSRLERANTSSHRRAQSLVVAHLLVEHLQICFNRFQWHLIDFGEVEACLDDLVELATSTDGSVKDDAKGHANDDGVDVDGQSGHEGSKTRKELATIITMAAQIYYIYIGGPK